MMPTIRVSDVNWGRMKSHARPLEDSADDVITRALDALDREKSGDVPLDKVVEVLKQKRDAEKVSSEKLPQKAFRMPLLQALVNAGGQAAAKDLRDTVYDYVKRHLHEGDHELVSSGDPRWWNATCWERSELVKKGVLRNDSERGTWAINEVAYATLHRRDLQDKMIQNGRLADILSAFFNLPPSSRENKYFVMVGDSEL